MKHYLFLISLLVLATLRTVADSTEMYHEHGKKLIHITAVQSNEVALDTINQEFRVSYKVYFADTSDTPVQVRFALPVNGTAEPLPSEAPQFLFMPSTPNYISGSFVAGDSLTDSLAIGFNKNNLPFYYQVVQIQVWDSAGDHKLSSAYFMVYFTPWNTIEIWNELDFEDLQRVWFSQANNHDTRVFIHKDSLPVSDLTPEEFFNDSIPKSYYSPKGLGYMIPVHWIDDEESSMMFERRADDCGALKKRWIGQVTGRIRANVRTDFPGALNTDINLSGVKVILRQREGSWLRTDKHLGVGFTDLDGRFVINVNKCIRNGVGDNIEIYVEIESINHSETIIVRKRLGGARKVAVAQNMLWDYNNGQEDNFDMGNLWPETAAGKPQLLHWADRCRNFVNQQLAGESFTLGSKSDPLIILIQPLGSGGGMCIPGGYLPTAVAAIVASGYVIAGPKGALVGAAASSYLMISMTNKDGIYIGKDADDELDEDLMYHEFGHYLMWHLQGQSWINPLEAGWADHSFRYNGENEKIAWTEGWAGGIGAIFDIAFRDDDGEAGLDIVLFNNQVNQIYNIERRWLNGQLIELTERNVRIGNTPGQNIQRIQTVTHGFVSEMNIVCAILDLYDGQGKGNILAPMAAEQFDDREFPNWPPGPGNLPRDLASFSFAQICKPLLNRQGSGLNSTVAIQNAVDYAYELARSLPCGEKHLVQDVWFLNAIRDFANPPIQLTSTDVIRREVEITTARFKSTSKSADNEANANLRDNGNHVFDMFIDVPVINTATGSFNLVHQQPGWGEYITDRLTIRDGEILHINDDIESNWVVDNELRPAQGSHLTAYFCNGETIVEEESQIIVGSALPVGGPVTPMTATAHLGAGSAIVLQGGTTPAVLQINNNSTFIIEVGGRLDIHPGARIVLNGPNAVLEVKGQIRLMQNADFTVEGGAQGFGYIKFHKNMNNNPKLLEGLGNNNITLTGTGTTHRLIEITGNEGWQIPPSITNVDISDCQITLGGGSRLNLENSNRFRLNNVDIDKITSLQSRHKGIYVWGWGMYSEIENVTIKGGIQGLLYYPIHRDEQFSDAYLNSRKVLKTHIVKNSRFEDNITGIKAIRVPVWLIDNEIDGYHTHGVRTYGTLSRDVYMVNNLIDNSGSGSSTLDTGVSFWGGIPMTNLLFRKNSVSGNRIGLYGFQTRVIPGCNTIENNNQIGLTMEGRADLFMNNVFNFGGYNTLNNNNSNILSRYWGRTSLNGGVNYFDMGSGVQFALFGNLVPYDPISYIANDNVFNVTVDPFLSPTVHSWSDVVNSGKNGYFKYEYSPSGLRNFSNVNIFNPSLIGNMITAECGKTDWETVPTLTNGVPPAVPVTYHDIVDMDNFPGGSYIIVTNDYWNVPIKDVLADLYLRAIELDGETPSDIVASYVDIFENSYTPIDSTREIFYELYSQMYGNLSYWINSGAVNTRVNDTLQEDNIFQQIADLIDDLIDQSATDSMHFLFDSEFNLQIEKIEVMRASSNYDIAQNLIDNLKPNVFTDPAKNFVLTKIECITQAENELFLGNYSPDSLLMVFGECLDLYFDDPYFDTASSELKISSRQEIVPKKESIQVWPNPAQNELNINILSEGLKSEFEIYNLVGNKVMSGNLQNGLQKINLFSIPNGLYIVKINSGQEIRSYKIVVMK